MEFETNDWKKFKRFLKNRGLFAAYCYNYRSQTETRNAWLLNRNKKHITELEPIEYVNYAFSWSKTKQGHMFWEKIDNMWKSEKNGWWSWDVGVDIRSW